MVFPAWVSGLKRPLQIGLAAAVVTAAITLFLPNYYKSEARILPTEGKGMGSGLGNLASAAAAFGVGIPGFDGSDGNFVDILQSRWMGEQLLQSRFRVRDRSLLFSAARERTQTLYDYFDEENADKALKELRASMGVNRDQKSKVVTLTVETKMPELSQQVVHKSVELLERFVQEKGRTRGGAKAIFAEARLRDARLELARVEDDLRRFLENNRNHVASLDPSVRLRGMRLEQEMKLHQQLVTSLALNRESALMEEKNDIPIVNVLDPGSLPIEKSRPFRSGMVAAVFAVVFLVALAWDKRIALQAFFRAD